MKTFPNGLDFRLGRRGKRRLVGHGQRGPRFTVSTRVPAARRLAPEYCPCRSFWGGRLERGGASE